MTKLTVNTCQLCNSQGGDLLWQDDCCRIVRVNEEGYPGFCRVILQEHISEMTDLDPPRRERLMQAVCATESALRKTMSPDKINLASLGNMVPHLHWHVIPRFSDDRHFPNSIWGEAIRPDTSHREEPAVASLAALLRKALS